MEYQINCWFHAATMLQPYANIKKNTFFYAKINKKQEDTSISALAD